MKRQNTHNVVHPETIRFWVEQSFAFAASLLWPNQRFSPREILIAYNGLHQYYSQIPPEDFSELIETEYSVLRLRLALYHVFTNSKNVLRPGELFDAQNPNGLFYHKPRIFTICGPVQICLN